MDVVEEPEIDMLDVFRPRLGEEGLEEVIVREGEWGLRG